MPGQGPEAQLLVAIQRRLVAQPLVVRIRIFVEVVVVWIEDQFVVSNMDGHWAVVSWLVSPVPGKMRPTT